MIVGKIPDPVATHRLTFGQQLRMEQTEEPEGRRIVGMAAVYWNGKPGTQYQLWPGTWERIMPGAFTRAIDEDDVRALLNHDPNQLLGRTKSGSLRLQDTPGGLEYLIQPGDDPLHQQVVSMIQRGDLDGSSFGFSVVSEDWTKDGDQEIREIREVKLYDVGPVTFPAYEATNASLRAIGADSQLVRDRWMVMMQRHRRQSRGRLLRLLTLSRH